MPIILNLPMPLKFAGNRVAARSRIRPQALRQIGTSHICTPVRIVVKGTWAPTGAKFVQARQASFKDERALYTAGSTRLSMLLSWLETYTTCFAVRNRRAECGGCSVQRNGLAPFSGANIPHIAG